jgi:ATP-binding cassette subfamily F protein uup
LRVLEEALVDFPGCAFIVSHDRYFLNRVATGILAFEGNGTITYSEGSYDRYLERKQQAAVTGAPIQPRKEETPKEKPKKEKRKLTYAEKLELERIEPLIAESEEEVARLEAVLQDPSLYAERGSEVPGLLNQLEEAKARVEEHFERWQQLEAILLG